MVQQDLNGNDILKEVIETVKTVYHAKFFDLTITEGGITQLEKIADAGKSNRQWIACHMKLKQSLVPDDEGACYQRDLETLKNMLDEDE